MKNNLLAISPLDGRYADKIEELSDFVSEYALIKHRVEIEIKYLLALSKIGVVRKINSVEQKALNEILDNFDINEALKVKEIENETRHDIKAVEKYLRDKFAKNSLKDVLEMIHFGLTSEDINNIAYRLMLKNAVENILLPALSEVLENLNGKTKKYKKVVILGRTHGQGAVPTTFGKEFAVFTARLEKEIKLLEKQKLTGKLNGAIGNYNALNFAYPEFNWIKFSKSFVSSFDLDPNLITTQINPYEDIISVFQNLQRVNGILLDFNNDMWRYASDGWIKLDVKTKEVGSSTMPQKVNPIDFENSEGNLTLANGFMQTINEKLYISRLQRDLSNSTIIRNLGTVLGYCLLGYKSALTGLSRVDINLEQIDKDLNEDWSILSEGLQTYLRKEGLSDSYYLVLNLTKGKKFNKDSWQKLINDLSIDKKHKEKLLNLTPKSYIGLSKELIG
ncbi:MAG: adenylosuccinate lyase [Patescibacteria group bacterium]|nr:adenylosuccinate lyase [Patescibacteria group bacterium]